MKIEKICNELLGCLEGKNYSELPSKNLGKLTIDNAYKIANAIKSRRMLKGERLGGVKIGFTNKSLWEKYGVDFPIFGLMYNTTIRNKTININSNRYLEPKIEPEIYFKFSDTPNSKMSDTELLDCCSSFGVGIEIVNSIYKNWNFTGSDAIAAFGLHAEFRYLAEVPLVNYKHKIKDLSENLAKFSISLIKDGSLLEKGYSSNILGNGPIEALRLYVLFCEKYMPDWLLLNRPITTGTITNAYDINAGETYILKVDGIHIQELVETTLGPIVV